MSKPKPTTFRPLFDKVLVKRDTAADKTPAGIILPDRAKDTPKMGTVKAAGPGVIDERSGARVPVSVVEGDRVIFSAYAGVEIKLEGVEYLVMSEKEILGVMADAAKSPE